jgi:DNA-binding MarR family transcriptional regulator
MDVALEFQAEAATSARPAAASTTGTEPMFDLIELMFFAYRDFVGDADRLLESFRFGRAHHRVLHFVNRQPGLTIAELLDILKITKQSLSRVLKELVDAGDIEVRAGVLDRRQRLLFPTVAGEHLALELAHLQSERFARALRGLPSAARAGVGDFLLAMVDVSERDKVVALIRREEEKAHPHLAEQRCPP